MGSHFSLKGMGVMVTGGAGFIGSHLVDRIAQESPARLVAVDNLFLGKEANLKTASQSFADFKFYRQDVTDYAAMKKIITAEQIQVVFNLAVIPLPTSLERPRWTVETNVAIATTMSELLREGYYRTLIHFSSSEAYGTAQHVPMDENHPLCPETPYAASKLAGDHVVFSYHRTFGCDVAIVRPFNNYGPRQNEGAYAGVIPIVVQRILRDEPIVIYGDGEQTRDFVFVRDTADAAVRVFAEPATRGQIINVASGSEVSINSLVRQIREMLKSRAPITYAAPREGDVRRHCGGIDLARRLIGFAPSLAMDHGLAETVAWYAKELQ